MEIIGYSERGLLNSIFYEIKYSPNSSRLLNELLHIFSFPYHKTEFDAENFKVLIEQSFSDLGDSDALLLMDGFRGKQSIFVEAKVKPSQSRYWSIEEEFSAFREEFEKVSSSNLFAQLYFKHRLVRELQKGDDDWHRMELDFPESLLSVSRRNRKIGSNEIVLKAVELLRQYCNEAYYVAVVPEDDSKLRYFHEDVLRNFKSDGFPEWDVGNWGYVSWKRIEDFCRNHDMRNALSVFEFNKGQIY